MSVVYGYVLTVVVLCIQASALMQVQDEQKMVLLYDYLADASTVYTEVFPLM